MDAVIQMQDDIHKLKKLIETLFDTIESVDCESEFDADRLFEEKDKIADLLRSLKTRIQDEDIGHLTANPLQDQNPESLKILENRVKELERERKQLNMKISASLKGMS